MSRAAVRRLLAVGGLVLLVGGCGLQARGPASVGPSVQVDRTDIGLPLSRDHEAPSLVIDKDDPNRVYLADVDMTTGECRFATSANRGGTWQEVDAPRLAPFTTNCALGSSPPQSIRTELVQGPDGTLYEVFQANSPDDGGGRSVLIGRTTDGGRSWKTVPIAAAAKSADPGQQVEVNFEGHIAIDPANPKRIYAMWRRSFARVNPPKPTRPMMATSDDGGATWSTPVVMFDRTLGTDGPRPLVVDGKLCAFWREAPPPTPSGQAGPSQAPPVTRNFVSISADQGRTWQDHEISNANDASEPIPAYDKARHRFYVVWHDNRANELDAYFSSSPDGIAWARPTRLNDDPPGNLRGQDYPVISMSPNGRIDVAWYDWRDDPFPPSTVGNGQVLGLFSNRGKFQSVYMTSSRDGGRTWTPNLQVSDNLIDRTIGTWANNADVMAPPAIASSDAGAVVAWSDTRNGNTLTQSQDTYTATVSFGTATSRRVTAFQAAVAGVLFGAGATMCLAMLLLRRQTALRREDVPGRSLQS